MDASSVVWTLIDNGKLANQIARLAAIVVKIPIDILEKCDRRFTLRLASLWHFI